MAETLNALVFALGANGAVAFARERYAETPWALGLLRPELADELAALDLIEKYAAHEVGGVDAVSFVLMRQNGIKKAFTFDGDDFGAAGFEVLPARQV